MRREDKTLFVGVIAIVIYAGVAVSQVTASRSTIVNAQGNRAANVNTDNRLETTAYQGGAWTITAEAPAMQSVNVAQVGGVAVLSDVPVSAASLPLPTGAAADSTLVGISGQLPAALTGGRLAVDGSAVVQPVSGSVTVSGSVSTIENPATSYDAEQLDATAVAQQLSTHAARAMCIKNLEASTLPVYLGGAAVSTTSGDELSVGESRCFSIDNTNRIYVRASGAGSRISFSWVN